MSEIDQSIAHGGGARPTARTASALLSAADIWSSAPSPAKTPNEVTTGRALPPQGRLVTLEADPRRAEVARGNFGRAGLADRIDLRVGAALDTLPILAAEGGAPFDFVFIDADKPNNSAYFSWALRLSRSGAVIVVDNVVREGAVADPKSRDPDVLGVRKFFDMLAAEPRVSATALQTVGVKGWDGLAIALVN